jgi:hypothetical protein
MHFFGGIAPLKLADQVICCDMLVIFLLVIRIGISLPLDQVLQLAPSARPSGI